MNIIVHPLVTVENKSRRSTVRPEWFQSRITIVGSYDNEWLKLAWSFCSENDNFSKARGRELAHERLANPEHVVEIKLGPDMQRAQLVEAALAATIKLDKSYPDFPGHWRAIHVAETPNHFLATTQFDEVMDALRPDDVPF